MLLAAGVQRGFSVALPGLLPGGSVTAAATRKENAMRAPFWTVLITIPVMAAVITPASAIATDNERDNTTPCTEQVDIVAVAPAGRVAPIERTAVAPVYEVTYRQCGREHRLLIQRPTNSGAHSGERFRPLFF